MPDSDDDDISGNTKRTVRDLELQLAEMFGREGDGGRFKALEVKVEKHDAVIETLKTFRAQVLIIVAVGGALTGLIATLISKLL